MVFRGDFVAAFMEVEDRVSTVYGSGLEVGGSGHREWHLSFRFEAWGVGSRVEGLGFRSILASPVDSARVQAQHMHVGTGCRSFRATFRTELCIGVSMSRGSLIETPKYYHPHSGALKESKWRMKDCIVKRKPYEGSDTKCHSCNIMGHVPSQSLA